MFSVYFTSETEYTKTFQVLRIIFLKDLPSNFYVYSYCREILVLELESKEKWDYNDINDDLISMGFEKLLKSMKRNLTIFGAAWMEHTSHYSFSNMYTNCQNWSFTFTDITSTHTQYPSNFTLIDSRRISKFCPEKIIKVHSYHTISSKQCDSTVIALIIRKRNYFLHYEWKIYSIVYNREMKMTSITVCLC